MIRTITTLVLATLLAACSNMSQTITPEGVVQKVTDFKASADANARMFEAQADVMFEAQKAVQKCYDKATTDVRVMACAMQAQSANFGQAMAGRPQNNRNPETANETAGDVGKTALRVGGAVATGKVLGDALSNAKPNLINSNNTTTTTTTTTTENPAAPLE